MAVVDFVEVPRILPHRVLQCVGLGFLARSPTTVHDRPVCINLFPGVEF